MSEMWLNKFSKILQMKSISKTNSKFYHQAWIHKNSIFLSHCKLVRNNSLKQPQKKSRTILQDVKIKLFPLTKE